ncbi:MAG: hypothetical protein M3P44_10330 [Actinomycetota bacterium]|nr:hypothetical protein [Actinomycetota bacterium]
MLIRESEWIGSHMAAIPDEDLFPLLNVGSSTKDFRTRTQPHIDANVFAPLRARGGKVWHLDIKAAEGVDLVGDLLDPSFRAAFRRLACRSILVSNLFEHVTDRMAVANSLLDVLPAGGYLIVTGPHAFAFHADPIDTMFRPTAEEMAAYFPGTDLVHTAMINAGNWRQWDRAERGNVPVWRMLVRLATPFYRPRSWLATARYAPYLVKNSTAFAMVLRRPPAGCASDPVPR